jgi:hypothetical protein
MSGTRTIVIQYNPQKYQKEIHDDTTRFKVLDIGRRGGKTEFVLNELIKKAVTQPGLYWYIGPSYRQAKSIAWVRLKNLLKPAVDLWKFNEQELYAEEKNLKTRIELKGADNEESLLGVGLKGVVFDESAMIKATVWPRIVRPMLADSQGWATFISTPKGRNWFHDLYARGMEGEKDWKSWHYPTNVNKYIPQEEIDEMKKDMPERLFRQEVMAEFLDDDTGVFKGVSRCIVGELEEPVLGRMYVIGVDLARTIDFTVLNVIDSVTRHTVGWLRFNEISWIEQKIKIQDLARKYNNALCVVDQSGVGDSVVDDLRSANVSVEPVKFTNASKTELINNLALAIEQRLVTFPPIEILIDELQSFEINFSPTGKIKYSAPEGKHDDAVIALALATWGIRYQLREAQVYKEKISDEVVDRQGQGELIATGFLMGNDQETEYEFGGY